MPTGPRARNRSSKRPSEKPFSRACFAASQSSEIVAQLRDERGELVGRDHLEGESVAHELAMRATQRASLRHVERPAGERNARHLAQLHDGESELQVERQQRGAGAVERRPSADGVRHLGEPLDERGRARRIADRIAERDPALADDAVHEERASAWRRRGSSCRRAGRGARSRGATWRRSPRRRSSSSGDASATAAAGGPNESRQSPHGEHAGRGGERAQRARRVGVVAELEEVPARKGRCRDTRPTRGRPC